jgi:transposase-like protein
MAEHHPVGMKDELARALAEGVSINAWARKHDVPTPTVYRWARETEVRKAVDDHRRRAADQAVGRMSKRYCWASDSVMALAEGAESETVRLAALKMIFSNMEAVTKDSGIEERMTEIIEERMTEIVAQLGARDRETVGTSPTAADEGLEATSGANRLAAFHGNGAC